MTRASRYQECLDYVRWKCNHYPFRHQQCYCFVLRFSQLSLVNRRHRRAGDITLISFVDHQATQIIERRIDILIAEVAADKLFVDENVTVSLLKRRILSIGAA